jgi:hypothetical protein
MRVVFLLVDVNFGKRAYQSPDSVVNNSADNPEVSSQSSRLRKYDGYEKKYRGRFNALEST